jgi:tripeptidyl-peptidase-2
VQCSTIAKVAQETINGESFNHLTGLSGRKLKIGDWNNPTGEFRLGLKHSFDIFPKDVVERIKESRKKKFEIEHHRLRSTVQSKTVEEKDKAQEFSLLTECLDEMIKTYEDPGILMDCVVFHDGTNWRAALDLLENGDLRNAKLLTSYGIEHEYVCFDAESMLNLSVNIYDEGSLLSIVTCNGSHGTHVAAITAAYHPEDPSINGVAPGAQIVSLKIGETKVGTMETGQGLVRAAIELYRLKVDVANMSYGEGTSVPNQGKFIQILRDDVVNKGGCVFVSSAGNEGPALTTVGCPGGTTSGIISVGAYVSQSMMEASYAMLSNVTERPYTWSSRGPTPDGDFGVDIYAPGAAITSVPQYTLSNNKLMNGTSMSSPNCAGCVALLVSGLKQKNIDYTPYFIKWAIKKTGKSIGDDLGVNFIQVVDAWNAMLESKDELAAMLNYNITVKDSSGIVGRGIYLREIEETSGLQEFLVTITPEFPDAENPNKHLSKFEFVDQVALDPSESWISTPNFFVITNQGITFKVRVDPSKLATGLHTGKIAAVAIRNSRKVKLFDVPVFVTKPFIVADRESPSSFLRFENLKFKPGDLNRNFINVPLGANFVEINVTCQGRPTNANFLVYLVQLNPQTARYKFSQETYFVLSSPESGAKEEPKTFKQMVYPVIPNVTLELCLGQFWSSLDETVVSVEVKFHGVYCSVSSATNGDFGAGSSPGGANLLFNNGYNGFSRVDVSAPIRKESINPKLTFGNGN